MSTQPSPSSAPKKDTQDLSTLLKQGDMQDLLEKLSGGVLKEDQEAEGRGEQQRQGASSADPKVSQNTNSSSATTHQQIPLELTSIEALTKRLAEDLGTNFLNDDEDEDDVLSDTLANDAFLSEDAFRSQLMRDFASLTEPSSVSKTHLKEIYLRILKEGASLLYDPSHAEKFLKDLAPQEMSALWNILAMTPDETIEYFDADPVVVEALKKAPSVAQMAGGANSGSKSLWNKLLHDDDDADDSRMQSSLDDTERVNSLLRRATNEVKDAIAVFEENLVQYSTHPERILDLCNKLSQEDQKIFLDILFLEYSPEKMEQKLRQRRFQQEEERAKRVESLSEISLDMNLVAHVFKEILTHMKAYKKYPEKFDPLIQKLNGLEKEALEAMIKAFWDVSVRVGQ
uniref:Uncharacterized protein n=1 Tax=Percolomonas cosmopolitus TaxID=63605 RepID=A0A7S1KQJ0_9EUKA|mmetsp:Transcript_4916/g.18490  ORF Transcript_4916/g.18490 Transcript_4916/m.18490 type:complete len:400 (+) Transcript_4916:251-1450(+)